MGMMMARRNLFALGGGWKNPYVTEGLIAMWDGIKGNWIDLVSGIVMDFVGVHEVKSDCVMIDGVNGAYAKVEGLSFSSPCTSEIVCSVDSFQMYGRFVAENRGLCMTSVRLLRLYGFGVDKDIFSASVPSKRFALSLTVEDGIATGYLNGNPEGSISCSSGSYSGTTTFFNRTGGGRGTSGDLCCVRFYDRALTPEEIAANYEVDKARFGLA